MSSVSKGRPAVWFAPILVLLAIVMIYPTLTLFWISVNRTRFFQPVSFVGLNNFLSVLSSDDFAQQARNSFLFLGGSLFLALGCGLITALLLQALEKRVAAIVRTILLLPWTLSMTVVGCLWLWLLNPSYGPVKYLLSLFGVQSGLMLGDPDVAIWLIIIASAWWSFPYAMVLITAALQSIPLELYEAVDMDGGSALDKFRHVTWPHVIPTLGSTGLALAIMYITLVSLIIVMTGGGPLGETTTFSFAIYQGAINAVDISPAAVLSVIVLLANLVLGIGYGMLLSRTKRVR